MWTFVNENMMRSGSTRRRYASCVDTSQNKFWLTGLVGSAWVVCFGYIAVFGCVVLSRLLFSVVQCCSVLFSVVLTSVVQCAWVVGSFSKAASNSSVSWDRTRRLPQLFLSKAGNLISVSTAFGLEFSTKRDFWTNGRILLSHQVSSLNKSLQNKLHFSFEVWSILGLMSKIFKN